MDLFFIDDSCQKKPSRHGMGRLVAIGGLHITTPSVGGAVDSLCHEFGFPPGEEFKWSPGPETWMHKGLRGVRRQQFYRRLLGLLKQQGAKAIVVVEDTHYGTAEPSSSNHVHDALTLFLERARFRTTSTGMAFIDRPGGNRAQEDNLLANCCGLLQEGTRFVRFDDRFVHIGIAPSRFNRLVQAADVVVGCTLARVAGEDRHSPAIFNAVRPLLYSHHGRIGGSGLKIHPDSVYADLYSELLSDSPPNKALAGRTSPLSPPVRTP